MLQVASIFERYRCDTEVILGENCLNDVLGEWCNRMGPEGILVFGQGHSVPVEEQEKFVGNLRSRGLSVRTVHGACADSPTGHVREICAGIDPASIHWVAAIGGGGVIDTGKILALRAQDDFAINITQSFEALQRRADEFDSVPLLAAPTCVGPGSEVSALADILLNTRGVRVPITSPVMYPKLAVVDSALASPPKDIQASAIVDAAAHLLDPWLNSLPEPPQEETTVSLLRALVRLTRNWRREGFGRSSLLKFATISHLAVRPGLARPSAAVSAVHRIEHALSPRIGCSHGEGLAILLPAFLRWMEAERPDALVTIADQFAGIFGKAAMPSTLVAEWLHSLSVRRSPFKLTDTELGEIADVTVGTFGDSHGLLPGRLSLGTAEVKAILVEAAAACLYENPTSTARPTHQSAVNTQRLFGGPIDTGAFHLVMTPIRPLFEMLSQPLGATIREGWFPTAVVNSSETPPTVLVCPPPGSSMAEDCLGFILTACGRPQSLLFVGLAGSLTRELHCGDIVSPAYVWSSRCADRTQRLTAIPLRATNGEPNTDRAWTVRSARRLTDESESLLEAWRWGGVNLVDLESSGVATICEARKIPFSALLVVSDRPLDGVSLWAQPPFTSEAIVPRSMERAAAYVREVIAKRKQVTFDKEQTYGFEVRH